MLYPVNRFLVVEVMAEQKKESGILVPDDYKQDRSVYSLVTLLKAGPESEFKFGSKLVVPTHMVEELNIFGEKHCVVLENHVVGILDN
jgi:co-chaperonin GroES (HSP10)|tara:strand:+ start:96 stop:359 length:264 start_codon:yes stop_codon:yes gene_type:complete